MANQRWFYKIKDEKHGPVSADELTGLFAQGRVDEETQVWCHGMDGWVAGRDRDEFVDAIRASGLNKTSHKKSGLRVGQIGEGSQIRPPLAAAGILACAILCLTWLMSSGKPPVYGLQGSLSYQGKPVTNGQLIFEPEPGKGQTRTVLVKDGSFSLPKAEGLPRNCVFVVKAYGYRKTGAKYENNDMSQSAEVEEQFLPPHLNSESGVRFETTAANLRAGLKLDLQ